MANTDEDETPYDQRMREARIGIALDYENVVSHLWNDRPEDFKGPFLHKSGRGGADGFAEADIWRNLEQQEQIRDVDVGFVLALKSIAHQITYLKNRVEELETRARA